MRRLVSWHLALCGIIFLPCVATTVHADEAGNARPLRPFYIIGHGANTLERAGKYLAGGANALEVDVEVMASRTNELCIGHGPDLGTGPAAKNHSIPLADYLTGLHRLGLTNNLCLVYFDCKPSVATPEFGAALLANIREYLEGSGPGPLDVTVLISVGKLKEKAIFARIAGQLGPREGVMVDGLSSPVTVSRYFSSLHVANQAFSDGVVPENSFIAQISVVWSVAKACWLRDHEHQIKFVGTWCVNNPWWMRHYIKKGVNGIIVDQGPVWYNFCWFNLGHGLRSLTRIVGDHGDEYGIRPATRADKIFDDPSRGAE